MPESNFFPEDKSSESDFFPEGAGKESSFFPDMSAVETLRNAMTAPLGEINMTMKDDLRKPNLFLRLVGIQEGIESATKNPMYQDFNRMASEIEQSDDTLAKMMVAPNMREAAGNMMLGNIAFSMADYESRPRRALVNLVALRAQRGMDRVKNPRASQIPLTKQDYTDAIVRGWSGNQDMGMIRALEGAVSPQYRVAVDRYMVRHPGIGKAMTAVDTVEEIGIAFTTEVYIAKGVGLAGKGLRGLTKLMGKAGATDSISDFVTDTVHHIIRADTDADDMMDAVLKQFGNDQDAIDDAFRNAQMFYGGQTPLTIQQRFPVGAEIEFDSAMVGVFGSSKKHATIRKGKIIGYKTDPITGEIVLELENNVIVTMFSRPRVRGAKIITPSTVGKTGTGGKLIVGAATPDDMVRGIFYRKYILDSIQTKTNPAGIIKQTDMNGLIEAATYGKKKMYTELDMSELEDIAKEVEQIKLAPSKLRNNMLEMVRRKSYGPPVNTFTKLGLDYDYGKVMSAVYTGHNEYNGITLAIIRAKKAFKKQFKVVWKEGDFVDNAMSYAQEGTKYNNLPDDVLSTITPDEFDFLLETASEIRDDYLNPWADISEFQGKISSDPTQIAAGVPPRIENHYHRVYDDISDSVKKRIKDAEEAGKKVTIPVDYDLDKLIKEGHIPAGKEAGAWIAREATREDYSRSYTTIMKAYAREVTYDLFAREEIIRLKATIDALPVDEGLKATAKSAARQWAVQIQNQPTGIDTTLNQAFNWGSRKMEKIFPKWEAQERAFENFTRFFARRTDQALLLGNPRPAVRNLFQPLLTTSNIYGNRATLWGYQQLLTPGGRKLLQTSQVYLGRGIPLAAFDVANPKSWKQLTYMGIKVTDKYLNVSTSYLAGWRYYFRRSPKAWDELVAFAKTKDISEQSLKRGSTFSGTVADAVNAGMFQDIRRAIDFKGIGTTQWLYDTASMPPSLRSTFAKAGVGKYTSWTQYMWGAHAPQLMEQLIHGKDIFGMKASPSVRVAVLQTVAKGALLASLGEGIGVSMAHLAVTGSLPQSYIMGAPMPIPIGPSTGTAIGLGAVGVGLAVGTVKALGTMSIGALSEDNAILDAGADQLARSLKAYIPAYGVARQIERVKSGEQPAAGILWPLPRKKKKKETKATIPGFPTFKKLKEIPKFPGLSEGP